MASLSSRIEHLRLRDLLLLEHIEQTGSLRMTADRLHVTQPAITQALRVLELAFGVNLVGRGQRGQRGVGLTSSGQAALVRLRIARQELIAAQEAALVPQVTTLRLGALPLALLNVLPKALVRLRSNMPEVCIELIESSVSGLWQALSDGRVDAIVCRFPSPSENATIPSEVVLQPVGSVALVIAAASSHPLAGKRRPTLKLLAQQAWILPPLGTFNRMVFDQTFVRAGIKPPLAAITSASFYSNLQLAAASGMLTVAPQSAVRALSSLLKLKRIPITWSEQNGELVLALRRSSLDNPAVANLFGCF